MNFSLTTQSSSHTNPFQFPNRKLVKYCCDLKIFSFNVPCHFYRVGHSGDAAPSGERELRDTNLVIKVIDFWDWISLGDSTDNEDGGFLFQFLIEIVFEFDEFSLGSETDFGDITWEMIGNGVL